MTKDTCAKCGHVEELDCPPCSMEWTCPQCGTKNIFTATYGDDLGCIPFEGPEARLPSGVYIVAGGDILDLICGLVVNKPGPGIEIVPWDASKTIPEFVIGIQIDQEAVDYIQTVNGGRGILLRTANAGPWRTLVEWEAEFGTNGLALIAKMRLSWNKTGGSVQVHKPKGRVYGLDAYKLEGSGQGRTHTGRPVVKLGKY